MAKLRLEGKVAIITGAASGIGEAAARLFAEHGARVVITDIQDELGAAVAASIGADRCKYYRCDVRDEQQVSYLVDFTVATFGRLDVMYSNAGIICRGSLLQMNLEDFDNVVAVNTRGCVAAVKHAGRAMAAAGTRGSIICTASVAATVGGMGLHAYTVSKHAVLGLVRSAAGELGHLGIRVNCVSPAGMATPLALGFSGRTAEQAEAEWEAMSALKRGAMKAGDVSAAALFLASDEAAFVSGHNLVVDGAMTAIGPKPPGFDLQ
ncbi:short-chain dehydrogenase reductase 3a-like [Ananas comosus]|uniref:Short-chain dehydrogenase reductase 3a-like n=1 Tax=Ananas comosus TaxID=4615 RepID=A0A6P5F5N6_ANACO|nr:short-chain dehydrogenase reductase 3a-like [Ananas comosus]